MFYSLCNILLPQLAFLCFSLYILVILQGLRFSMSTLQWEFSKISLIGYNLTILLMCFSYCSCLFLSCFLQVIGNTSKYITDDLLRPLYNTCSKPAFVAPCSLLCTCCITKQTVNLLKVGFQSIRDKGWFLGWFCGPSFTSYAILGICI